MSKKSIFLLTVESYIMEMIRTRFHTEDVVIDFTNPEQQVFVDYHLQRLQEDKNLFTYDEGIVFITNYTLDVARSLFGNTVCTHDFTRLLLAEMLAPEYRELDYYDIVESLEMNVELKTKEDIDNWFADQRKILLEIKESNYLDIVG